MLKQQIVWLWCNDSLQVKPIKCHNGYKHNFTEKQGFDLFYPAHVGGCFFPLWEYRRPFSVSYVVSCPQNKYLLEAIILFTFFPFMLKNICRQPPDGALCQEGLKSDAFTFSKMEPNLLMSFGRHGQYSNTQRAVALFLPDCACLCCDISQSQGY